MGKFKRIYILVLIIVVLLAILIATTRKKPKELLITHKGITGLRIERVSDTTEIILSVAGPRIIKPFDYPADSFFIKPLVSDIGRAELGDIISENSEKFADFGVADNGVKVTIIGPKTRSFYIGKHAGDYQSSYLRFPRTNKVYLVKGLSRSSFDRKPDEWRDKSIISFNKEAVNKIIIDKVEITKVDTLWYLNKKTVDKNRVMGLLSQLSNLRATGFADTLSFEPRQEVEILAEQFAYKFQLGDSVGNNYLLKLADRPTIFLVNEWTIKRMRELLQ